MGAGLPAATSKLSGAGCATGTAAAFVWPEALQRAADANDAGHTDWRLPNKHELESLVEQRCYLPCGTGY